MNREMMFWGSIATGGLWGCVPAIIILITLTKNPFVAFIYFGFLAWVVILLLMVRWGSRKFDEVASNAR